MGDIALIRCHCAYTVRYIQWMMKNRMMKNRMMEIYVVI